MHRISPERTGEGTRQRALLTTRRRQPQAAPRPGQRHAVATLGPGTPAVEIEMPPAFAAFCLLRLETYTRYAALRVGNEQQARTLVRATLGELAMMWTEALQSPSPAALAWRLLAARTGRVAAAGRSPALYRLLPTPQADAVLLRYRLGLPEARAAEVMGRRPEDFACLLRAAVRNGIRPCMK